MTRTVLRGHRGPVNDVAYSPDGHAVVTAGTDGTSVVWHIATGEIDHDLRAGLQARPGRGHGPRATIEQLWQHGCRNGSAGGHMAICLSNCFRSLETIG